MGPDFIYFIFKVLCYLTEETLGNFYSHTIQIPYNNKEEPYISNSIKIQLTKMERKGAVCAWGIGGI